jgi:hypothetical protein
MTSLLAAKNVLSTAVITAYWAPEIGEQHLTPRQLAMMFTDFLLQGGADAYPGAVLANNKEQGQTVARSSREWREWLNNTKPKWRNLYGEGFDELVWYVISHELIVVTREAVWAYCDATGIAAPSFWSPP